MIISIFIVAFRCDVIKPWVFINAQCNDLVRKPRCEIQRLLMKVKLVRWEIETVFDIVTELALFSASIYLVQGLQLSASKKGTVILAFGLRLA